MVSNSFARTDATYVLTRTNLAVAVPVEIDNLRKRGGAGAGDFAYLHSSEVQEVFADAWWLGGKGYRKGDVARRMATVLTIADRLSGVICRRISDEEEESRRIQR